MPDPLPTAEQVAARLAPDCRLSTLEVLARLAAMTHHSSSTVVHRGWFASAMDLLWLQKNRLVEQRGHRFAITPLGTLAAHGLVSHLRTLAQSHKSNA